MEKQNSAFDRGDFRYCTHKFSYPMLPGIPSLLTPQTVTVSNQSMHIKQEYFENDTASLNQQVIFPVKTESFESSPPNQHNILQSFNVEVKEEDNSYDKDCGWDECEVNREYDLEGKDNDRHVTNKFELPLNKHSNLDLVNMKVKAEEHSNDPDCGCDECVLDRGFDHDTTLSHQPLLTKDIQNTKTTLQMTLTGNADFESSPNENKVGDWVKVEVKAEEHSNEFDFGGVDTDRPVKRHRNEPVNDEDGAMNVDLDDDAGTSANEIEVQHFQKGHLSDIDYELEMLRNVFIKSIGDQFWCNYPQCGKQFGPDEQLTHLKLHTKPCVCDFVGCRRRFIGRGALTEHRRSHNIVKGFKCDLPGCVKRFKNIGTLNLHKRDHRDKNVFICEWRDCDKVITSEGRYRVHLALHSDDGLDEHQLMCNWAGCARKFTTQYNLLIHGQVHTGDSASITHPRVHAIKRQFGCLFPECGQAFHSLAQLRIHSQVHSHNCQFGCDQCNGYFTEDAHLATHLLTHKLKHPFECPMADCGQTFTSSSKLKRHFHSFLSLSSFRYTNLCRVCSSILQLI